MIAHTCKGSQGTTLDKLYTNTLHNRQEKNKYLETHNLSRVHHDETGNQKGAITSQETELAVKAKAK